MSTMRTAAWLGKSLAQQYSIWTNFLKGSFESSKKEPERGHIFLPLWRGQRQQWLVLLGPLEAFTQVIMRGQMGHPAKKISFESDFIQNNRVQIIQSTKI